jgi:hypothetical protein
MDSRCIEINVDRATGVITYNDPARRARRREEIRWKCQAGPFALQFTGETPVEFQGNRSTRRNGAEAHELKGTIKENAAPGVYQYGCSVYAGEEVYLDARCPVIIIDLDV